MPVEVWQHIPSFVHTGGARRFASIADVADLDHVSWIAQWRENPPHTFDHWAGAHHGRLLLAVFDRGSYWWVVGFLSGPLPGLPEWAGPPEKRPPPHQDLLRPGQNPTQT